jgi:hypothetical protein
MELQLEGKAIGASRVRGGLVIISSISCTLVCHRETKQGAVGWRIRACFSVAMLAATSATAARTAAIFCKCGSPKAPCLRQSTVGFVISRAVAKGLFEHAALMPCVVR